MIKNHQRRQWKMAGLKYARNIIMDTKPLSPDIVQKVRAMRKKTGSTVQSTRLLWLDDEKYILKNTCLVFVPKGLKHCPLQFNRIDSPILFFTIGTGGMYKRSSEEKEG
jgi:hypothetical protein